MHYIDQFLSEQYISSAIRLKARTIYSQGKYQLKTIDFKSGQAVYTVESASNNGRYNVEIEHFNSHDIGVSCSCPASNFCKHMLTALNDLRLRIIELPTTKHDQHETYVDVGAINTEIIKRNNITEASLKGGTNLKRQGNATINQAKDSTLNVTVKDGDNNYLVIISETSDKQLKTSCRCKYTDAPLCPHKIAALLAFQEEYGDRGFDKIRNYDKEKEILLNQYGYSLKDDIEGLFHFEIKEGDLRLIVKDASIEKVGQYAEWKKLAAIYLEAPRKILLESDSKDFAIAYVWALPDDYYPMLRVMPIYGKRKKSGKIGAPLREIDTYSLKNIKMTGEEMHLYQALSKISNNPYGNKWNHATETSNGAEMEDADVYFDIQEATHQIIGNEYIKLSGQDNYLLKEKSYLASNNLVPITLNKDEPSVSFKLEQIGDDYILNIQLEVSEEQLTWDDLRPVGYGFLLLIERNELIMLQPKDARTLHYFYGKKHLKVKTKELARFFDEFLIPLMKKHPVHLEGIKTNIKEHLATPHRKLYVKEMDDFLLLIPAFRYHFKDYETEVEMDNGEAIFIEEGKKKVKIIRDKDVEQETFELLKGLHTSFEDQRNRHYFYLPIKEVLKSNWFFKAFEKISEHNIEVLGLKTLSKIKYNPFRPKMMMRASSGTDWFDLKINVSFGSQQVRLQDIRRAILNNDQFVKLGDGTMGILPEEWLAKYAAMFRAAKVKQETLQLSQFQHVAIENFYKEIDNYEVLENLREKIERLKAFRAIKKAPVPSNVKAALRSYQQEGFNWLRFLHEFGWGGCLADDMGLGKTLQALAFIQSLVNDDDKTTVLVVVPRSLIFNWELEAKKFCPELKILVYSGIDRRKKTDPFHDYHIVLTTYSLVRNDIEVLREFHFDYVILDESQAIKNPASLISKAVKLLKAKNRLIMTGTPIENNTFDLYAQMDFLNPGMLGSIDYFRKEYSNKIDRDRDQDKVEELQRIVNPFILSRKKEDVAKELPEKTETVIYCELGKKQRKTYDYFKNKYYEKIKAVIEEEGMAKSGMYVLQGLLKLRQICNSTALIKEEGDFGNESVKLEVIMNELQQVAGQKGKALVFSYFVEMLDIVAKELETLGIGYTMLTGSSVDREKIVNDFKTNEENKIFLISLKAGGFGLNLTEANYVFMIDPWWNPAVEQQAIDRTHRIGQDQNVFAYKLICRNTIEEKILELQEKKQAVAKDIINVEAGFMKKLSQEDLAALFA